uniref:Uncharacterized protein n=1 Tax=Romanomermis culicivorax TaxID=13658 RepID=A0A915LDF2_ROMCU
MRNECCHDTQHSSESDRQINVSVRFWSLENVEDFFHNAAPLNLSLSEKLVWKEISSKVDVDFSKTIVKFKKFMKLKFQGSSDGHTNVKLFDAAAFIAKFTSLDALVKFYDALKEKLFDGLNRVFKIDKTFNGDFWLTLFSADHTCRELYQSDQQRIKYCGLLTENENIDVRRTPALVALILDFAKDLLSWNGYRNSDDDAQQFWKYYHTFTYSNHDNYSYKNYDKGFYSEQAVPPAETLCPCIDPAHRNVYGIVFNGLWFPVFVSFRSSSFKLDYASHEYAARIGYPDPIYALHFYGLPLFVSSVCSSLTHSYTNKMCLDEKMKSQAYDVEVSIEPYTGAVWSFRLKYQLSVRLPIEMFILYNISREYYGSLFPAMIIERNASLHDPRSLKFLSSRVSPYVSAICLSTSVFLSLGIFTMSLAFALIIRLRMKSKKDAIVNDVPNNNNTVDQPLRSRRRCFLSFFFFFLLSFFDNAFVVPFSADTVEVSVDSAVVPAAASDDLEP